MLLSLGTATSALSLQPLCSTTGSGFGQPPPPSEASPTALGVSSANLVQMFTSTMPATWLLGSTRASHTRLLRTHPAGLGQFQVVAVHKDVNVAGRSDISRRNGVSFYPGPTDARGSATDVLCYLAFSGWCFAHLDFRIFCLSSLQNLSLISGWMSCPKIQPEALQDRGGQNQKARKP